MKKAQAFLAKHLKWLEYIIGIALALALLVIGGRMAVRLWDVALTGDVDTAFTQLLKGAFTLIIGIEFIKMIIKPTSANVLEVIMFTIARSLIVEHSSMLSCLLGVVALAVVFLIRKHLFCEIVQHEQPDVEKPGGENEYGLFGVRLWADGNAKDTANEVSGEEQDTA